MLDSIESAIENIRQGKMIIVVDDVANSGKTLLYAMKPFLNFHPRKIESLVLVGRTHKAFPVQPDYTGLFLSTTLQEHIYVEVGDGRAKGRGHVAARSFNQGAWEGRRH